MGHLFILTVIVTKPYADDERWFPWGYDRMETGQGIPASSVAFPEDLSKVLGLAQ